MVMRNTKQPVFFVSEENGRWRKRRDNSPGSNTNKEEIRTVRINMKRHIIYIENCYK